MCCLAEANVSMVLVNASPTKPHAPVNPNAHPAPTAARSKPRAASGFSCSRALKGATASPPAKVPQARDSKASAPSPQAPVRATAPSPVPPVSKPHETTATAACQSEPAPASTALGWDSLDVVGREALAFLLGFVLVGGYKTMPLQDALDKRSKHDPMTAEEHANEVYCCIGLAGYTSPYTGAAVSRAVQFLQDSPARIDEHGRLILRLPKTVAQAALLQSQIDQWLQQGELWQAFPSQCVLAVYGLWTRPDHADTLRTVSAVALGMLEREEWNSCLYEWLLPRHVRAGLNCPTTRRVIEIAAMMCVCTSDLHSNLVPTVVELAQQLPGGLGWGSTVVAPVPDEEAFIRHAVMQSQASSLSQQGEHKAAQDMLKRCVAYYDTLGQHWLAVPRKVSARVSICSIVRLTEGAATSEPIARQLKREAIQALGPAHPGVAGAIWEHGLALLDLRRYEQGMSLIRRSTQLRQTSMVHRFATNFHSQVRTAYLSADTEIQ